ncbi:MAG: sugar transferase [Candidatus Woesearchaeota archaeon]
MEQVRISKKGYDTDIISRISDTIDSYTSRLFNDIFYMKNSLGKEGRSFKAYKFRTMKKDSEYTFLELVAKQGLDDKGKIRDDPRVTPFGKILRRYWIDELPQLYNVIRSDMKIVGIRPMEEDEWSAYPQDIKVNALKYKPGFLGVNYLGGNDAMRKYLKEYEKAPILTDIRYGSRIAYNILFRGMRST